MSELGNMSDKDFEEMLESSVSGLPPEDIVSDVTPWKRAIKRVLVGMSLSTVTLNFWYLDVILPAIGIVLMLLGLRALRHENKWFAVAFVLAILRAVCFFSAVVINTTVFQSEFHESFASFLVILINLILQFCGIICLCRAFISVQRKVGIQPHTGGAGALILWFFIMCVLAALNYRGFIIPVLMIILFVLIIRSLYKLSKELDEAGYAIKTTVVKINDIFVVISLAFILLVGMGCGYAFGGSYPMEWELIDKNEHAEVEDIKAELIELGFPEYVLNDLTAEDIKACEGAINVIVDVDEYPVNDGIEVVTEKTVGVNDVNEIRITGVAVELPGEKKTYMIFQHFLWTEAPGFYGTESIQLWPPYRNYSDGWRDIGDVSGRILYDNGGETFVSDYYSLGEESFSADSIIFGNQISTDVFAAFSMPRDGSAHRGYLAYPVEQLQDGYLFSGWFNYTHQITWAQYPAVTAKAKRMTNAWNKTEAFRTVQTALQFRPGEDEGESE